jgi:UDP-N-acetyl-D-galactosamine dehydrogenase
LISSEEASREFGIELQDLGTLRRAHCIVLAVAHKAYVQQGWALLQELLHEQGRVVMDAKGVLPRESVPEGVLLWRL